MRRISVFIVMVVAIAGCGGPKKMAPIVVEAPIPDGPPAAAPMLLGVGLAENMLTIEISATGAAELVASSDGRLLLSLAAANSVVRCESNGGKIQWSAGGKQGREEAVVLRVLDPNSRLRHSEQQYRGELLVISAPVGGGLTLVNNVHLESYLKGVVPWEIGRHPAEKQAAVEAQAVAARTYTVSHWGARRHRGFDVFASVMDQVYKGSADEDALCNEAVDSTAGLVLMSEGEEVEAYYSACCGGSSSNIEEVWARGSRPYLQAEADGPDKSGNAFCGDSRYYSWNEQWTGGRIEEILNKTLPEYMDWVAASPARAKWAGAIFSPRDGSSDASRPGAIWDIEILSHTTSGRVANLAISTDAGVYHVRADRTRWVLEPPSGNPFILRSAQFSLDVVQESGKIREVIARGQGFGHGIGLCQTGALARASQGQSFQEILAHYYPGAVLTRR